MLVAAALILLGAAVSDDLTSNWPWPAVHADAHPCMHAGRRPQCRRPQCTETAVTGLINNMVDDHDRARARVTVIRRIDFIASLP